MTPATAILAFADYRPQAERLGEALSCPVLDVEVHRFPDGESLVRLPTPLPPRVIVCRSLDQPNDKLIELFLTATTARTHGVQHLTLVAPYLCYMRQDIAFQPGEAISQRIIGNLLAQHFDAVITIDAHLHRVHDLAQAIPARQAINLNSTEAFGSFLANTPQPPLLVGPDAESEQWVAAIAAKGNFDYVVAHKQRLGDNEVSVTLPDYPYAGQHVILVDDIISTGHTLAEAAKLLRQRHVAKIACLTTHALFSGEAESLIHEAGVEHIWSSDSVSHHTNSINLAPWLAQAVLSLQQE